MREKVGKSRNTVFFQWFVAPEGRKVGSLKRRVRSQLATGAMKNCTPLWREAHFEVKMYKTHHAQITFGSWDVEKVHAVVARSTFRSQKLQKTSVSDHFWKLRCQKSARRCGAKHISKSKCTKHTQCSDHFWKLRCRKSARRCGAKHISKSKCTKHTMRRTTFGSRDVEKVHALVARSTFPSQNVQSTTCSRHFWRFGCWKSARRCGAKHISKSKCTKHYMFGRFRCRKSARRCGAKHISKLKCYKTPGVRTTFGGSDVASLHYTTLHCTTLHSTTLRSTTLHYITQHYNYNYTTTLHYNPLH